MYYQFDAAKSVVPDIKGNGEKPKMSSCGISLRASDVLL
jgi:hypothetical protein